MGSIRINSGVYRSRVIRFKDNNITLRPTPNKVRGTLFNWLSQDLTDKECLDLFAGSGAISFEALSRNAKNVISIDNDLTTIKDLRKNQQLLKCNNLTIIHTDALSYLTKCQQKFDLIFLDPPYNSTLLNQSIKLIEEHQLLNTYGIIYIEYYTMPLLNKYTIYKSARSGIVKYALLK
jgi:16S rRNA (guanine966-N2)-methyltransferase